MEDTKKPRRSKTPLILSAVVLFVIGASLAGYKGCAERTAAANRTKVMIIGLDALDWDILNPLLATGKLPNIKKLIDNGTSGYLQSYGKLESPVIWTTIATGKLEDQHGIKGFFLGSEDAPTQTPYTSADRKVAALWNIMGMEKRTVACFGWWCTWPSEKVNGVMVSAFTPWDPVQYFRRGIHTEKSANLTYPNSLYKEIKPYMVDEKSITLDDIKRFVNFENESNPMFKSDRIAPSVQYVLPWTLANDRSYVSISEYVLGKKKCDLSMVYIEGTDTLGHRFWAFREGGKTLHDLLVTYGLNADDQATFEQYFKNTIDNYYIYTDELVGRLLKLTDDKTVVIVCSDHGLGPSKQPIEGRWEGHTFGGEHRDRGVIIMSGPGVRKGKRLNDETPPHVLDITPTVLAILGLPLASDMPGTPIVDAFSPNFMNNYSPEMVQSYDVNYQKGERPESIQMSGEYEERLRSLGYIQ